MWRDRQRHFRVASQLLGIAGAAVLALPACGNAAAPSSPGPSVSYGPVTPAPQPGAFDCPVQVLAGSPPTSRLVGVAVTPESSFERVAFAFAPGTPPPPSVDSGLIVRPVGVLPKTDANKRPLTIAGSHFIEVRFRDMALTNPDGSPSFAGSSDVEPTSGAVRGVVEIEASALALDWLIGTTTGCARVWVDAGRSLLLVDVAR